MSAWQLVLAGTGAAVGFATVVAAGFALLGRVFGPREWRLDHRSNRRQL